MALGNRHHVRRFNALGRLLPLAVLDFCLRVLNPMHKTCGGAGAHATAVAIRAHARLIKHAADQRFQLADR